MANCIYGVDLSKKITPIIVRDAMIDCFIQAHKEVLDKIKENGNMDSEQFEEMKRINVEFLVERAFADINGDYGNPDKESLIKVVEILKKYAANYRTSEIIKKHTAEIMQLIKRLK